MEADQTSTDVAASSGCAERDRRIARLEAQVKQLQQHVEALSRSAKRQAAPFSRGLPKVDPERSGRKSGDDYGTKAFRAVPPVIDEIHEAPLSGVVRVAGNNDFSSMNASSISIRWRFPAGRSTGDSTSPWRVAPAAANGCRGGIRCKPPTPWDAARRRSAPKRRRRR